MVPSSVGLRRTLITALAASFILVVPLGGIAVAQEGGHAVVTDVGAISFTELGRRTDVMFSKDDEPVSVLLPVPDGLTAAALVGTITAPSDFNRGWIEVGADGPGLAD